MAYIDHATAIVNYLAAVVNLFSVLIAFFIYRR